MLFNSLAFLVYLVAVLAVYYALPHRGQNGWLLLCSYAFYGAWDWRFLSLILLSTAVDYTVGLLLMRTAEPALRKILLGVSICTNLGILIAFKYAGFFVQSLVDLLSAVGLGLDGPTLSIVLPVGLSFYTFQTLGYSIDVYRKEVPAARDPLDFALFVAFFPQLVAGPIERARRLLPQIAQPRRLAPGAIGEGSWLILWGLFKKVVVADNLSLLNGLVFHPEATPQGPEVALAIVAVSFSIYCDFSGYSDIARGLAKYLGFELMVNFRLPFWASNPTDLWRRWHVSLCDWFRDYLYRPLGGSFRHMYRNILLVFAISGLWHGAAWNFVAWGLLNGIWLVIHRLLRRWLKRVRPRGRVMARLWHATTIAATFTVFSGGLMLFQADSIGHSARLCHAMLTRFELGMTLEWLPTVVALITPVILIQSLQVVSGKLDAVLSLPRPLRVSIYTALFLGIVLLGVDTREPFLYFQF